MSKKGDVAGPFVFMITAFILVLCCAIFVFIGNTAYSKIMAQNETLQAAGGPGMNATEVISNTVGKLPTAYSVLKWASFMLIVGLAINTILAAFLTQERPLMFIPYVFIWIISIIVSVPMSNTFETVYSNPLLASSFSGFWSSNAVLLNLPIWLTVLGFVCCTLVCINMIKKSRSVL